MSTALVLAAVAGAIVGGFAARCDPGGRDRRADGARARIFGTAGAAASGFGLPATGRLPRYGAGRRAFNAALDGMRHSLLVLLLALFLFPAGAMGQEEGGNGGDSVAPAPREIRSSPPPQRAPQSSPPPRQSSNQGSSRHNSSDNDRGGDGPRNWRDRSNR